MLIATLGLACGDPDLPAVTEPAVTEPAVTEPAVTASPATNATLDEAAYAATSEDVIPSEAPDCNKDLSNPIEKCYSCGAEEEKRMGVCHDWRTPDGELCRGRTCESADDVCDDANRATCGSTEAG